VLLDVYMPEMNGLETLQKIRELYPDIIVVMISAVAEREAAIVVEALGAGALDFIRKPGEDSFEENVAILNRYMTQVARIIKMRVAFKRGGVKPTAAPLTTTATPGKPPAVPPATTIARPPTVLPALGGFAVLVIGVSTGGPNALAKVIPALPASFPLPVLIVQHMPEHFTASLASSLNGRSPLNVVEGAEEMKLEPGKIIIAPGGKHMTLTTDANGAIVTTLNTNPPVNSCRPAVDVLFDSVAKIYQGKKILALILTGMGNDGEKGVKRLKQGKCHCVTQSEETCVIYGMPEAVDRNGLSDISLDLGDIAPYLATIGARRF